MLYRFYKCFVALLLWGVNPFKAYGDKLFEALARLTTSLAFEAACVRRRNGKVQVALAQRKATESYAPLQWHFPGTFYRPWETAVDVLKRLVRKEFGWLKFGQIIYVGTYRATKADIGHERGHANSELWLILDGEFSEAVEWFDHDTLPKGIHFRHFNSLIPWAIEAFERWEKGGVDAVPKIDTIEPAALEEAA